MTDAIYDPPADLSWMDTPSRRVYKYILKIKLSRGELTDDRQRRRLGLLAMELVLAEQLDQMRDQILADLPPAELKRQFKYLQIVCRDLQAAGIDEEDLAGINMEHPHQLLFDTHNKLQEE